MKFSWTREQRQVIDLRQRNILVSAAAGSGKTAVLVERILEKISDRRHPLDIDRLLIVTFTNAAAGEMKERIRQALEERVEAEPENEHLQKQLTFIHHAQITTIHSFCLHVIRSHFHQIELDPAFRIGDEGELNLLQADVLEKMLEEHYQTGEEDFLKFVETYATGRDDSQIVDLIAQCYRFSTSYPWPQRWLDGCLKNYQVESVEELEQTEWMGYLLEQIRMQMMEYVRVYDRILSICRKEDGPYAYIEKFELERQRILSASSGFSSYEQARACIAAVRFEIKPRRKKADIYSEEKAGLASGLRDRVKAGIRGMQKAYFTKTAQQVLEDIQGARPAAEQMIGLTKEFAQQYAIEKRKKNLVDFNDLEHLALEILVKEEDGRPVPTEIADEYAQMYEEIMIDEYQDSNYVQEVLLNSVSSERFGRPNVFMVGDVKQSIYKFRLAKPEIFMKKYSEYEIGDSLHQKVELHQNFRSRESVLSGINYVFRQIMRSQLGEIEYTEETALHPGLPYEETEKNAGGSTELLLLDLDQEEGEKTEKTEYLTDQEWEARLIANKIRELTDAGTGQYVWDKNLGKYRLAEYRDIVVLLRTINGWAEPFVEVLMSQGIPAYAESQSGYFTATEIQTVLNLLRVIDNPIQDIALASVMSSPIGGFAPSELAQIRISCREKKGKDGLFGAVKFYLEHFEQTELGKKTGEFLEKLRQYQKRAAWMPIHELLLFLLADSGYYEYILAMPGGERRKANMDMLVEKAIQFESTSYHGLFQFIRYIEKLQKFSVDYGEASTVGENENTVRIMSIHKSKGLEFPIVILGGMGKRFNQQDSRSRVAFHPDFGVGIDYVNPELRTRTPTLIKKIFQKKLALENLGEELRVLYVALTRTKEKLIMTGTRNGLLDYLEKQVKQTDETDEKLSYENLSGASSYLDWLIPVLSKHRVFAPLHQLLGHAVSWKGACYEDPAEFLITLCKQDQMLMQEVWEAKSHDLSRMVLETWDDQAVYDEEAAKKIEKVFRFNYDYNDLAEVQATMSVSELKRLHLDETEVFPLVEEAEAPKKKGEEKRIPRFVQEEEVWSKARRGTIYHKVLEFISVPLPATRKGIETGLQELVEKEILSEEEKKLVWVLDFLELYTSSLGKRIQKAREEGHLNTEKQFIIGVSPEEIRPGLRGKEGELLMVQGVIDACFEENGEWILVDYKTDRVPEEGGEEELRRRYDIQLEYYEKALRMITGKPIKEKWIYSFSLHRAIRAGEVGKAAIV